MNDRANEPIVERVRRALTADRRNRDPNAAEATTAETLQLLTEIDREDNEGLLNRMGATRVDPTAIEAALGVAGDPR